MLSLLDDSVSETGLELAAEDDAVLDLLLEDF